jgi:hypothetical protein
VSAEESDKQGALDMMSVSKAGQGADVKTTSEVMRPAKRARLVGPTQAIDNDGSAGGETHTVYSHDLIVIGNMR